ncbi:hypothetical protein INR49_021556 [Caranx melampygus]|nr:hypothetical protein INR49_021556 [Caranx melampygus]
MKFATVSISHQHHIPTLDSPVSLLPRNPPVQKYSTDTVVFSSLHYTAVRGQSSASYVTRA